MKYTQIQDGEWIRPEGDNYREQCCDCGLVHNVEFRIVDGHVEWRAVRNAKATAACRRTKPKRSKR